VTESVDWEDPQDYIVFREGQALQQANDKRVQALEAQGIGIQPLTWLAPRIMLLCDELIGTLPAEARAAFELKLQMGYTETLDKIESEVRQKQLMANLSMNQAKPAHGGLIIP
jgi:hypothetical protein